MDLVHIKEAGYNAILHTWSEEDLQYYYDTMKQIVNDSAAMGLSVYVNPWGVGRVFGGEAYSELTARNHDMCQVAIDGKPKVAACPNHPEFRAYMHKWIATVCDTNVSTIFWDEPHFYFEKGGLSNWSCRCEKCRAKFRTKFGYEMPAELTDDVKHFREESLIDSALLACEPDKLLIIVFKPELFGKHFADSTSAASHSSCDSDDPCHAYPPILPDKPSLQTHR